MEFATKFNREPDDADYGYCECCGRKIDLNYEDYEETDAGYMCEYCSDDMHHAWKGEIIRKEA